ncbi:hypothetical protein [Actinobaculum sp. 313]|uniref:hypothetical protein n=1 Tax=Actinobaculum sp. 313 TaxID=2495645 RepID=UPI000F747C38|nr:hypothetical protein [Actinobaculum sp. 313]
MAMVAPQFGIDYEDSSDSWGDGLAWSSATLPLGGFLGFVGRWGREWCLLWDRLPHLMLRLTAC